MLAMQAEFEQKLHESSVRVVLFWGHGWVIDLKHPPFGPSYLTTNTVGSSLVNFPVNNAAVTSSSESNTLAFPAKTVPSFPVIFATAPPGAKLPYRTCKCPVDFSGFESGRMMTWSWGRD